MISALHLPLDLDLREPVRRLGRRLRDPERAVLYVFRLWQDWGRCGMEFRPIQVQSEAFDPEAHPWAQEDLAFVIEEYCGWGDAPGDLIRACIACGLMSVERRGGLWGLVLTDFWQFNEHLSPSHKTIQQLGGLARHSKRQAAELEKSAGDQARILEMQRMLPLEYQSATSDERKGAVLLLMRLDRACGLPVRKTTE